MKLEKLAKIEKLTPLKKLKKDQVEELQKALNYLNYSVGAIDGDAGVKTRKGLSRLMCDFYEAETVLLGNDAVEIIQQKLDKSEKENDKNPNTDDLVFELKLLRKIKKPLPLRELDKEQLEELQTALHRLGYPVGAIDGLLGARTRTAWAEYKTDIYQGNPEMIGAGAIEVLQQKLDNIANGKLHDFSTVEGTIEAIKQECNAQQIGMKTQIAYVLATVEWETARENLIYYPFYGRGYVQLTWEKNYEKYSEILGGDLVKNPDTALDENISLFILIHGFKMGTFTGRKITDYINDFRT
ncbi:MAG: glycoside hydrolase family 19 protein, partial [Aridibacter sp.]